ncbi:MAG: sigma-54-dependent Fis family transcriptional regulator [Deltaproteobacteria bacterium]|nr:sigma-54-dependent Fis family transcriptional regulator [Deltaproteobacteria bacterium]
MANAASQAHTRILVVDDEENIRIMLGAVLKKQGYEVDAVANGADALDALRKRPYDLIISDFRMPQMDGLEMLRRIRDERIRATVIMITAYGGNDQMNEAMRLGAHDYISKPFRAEEILLVVKKAEARKRANVSTVPPAGPGMQPADLTRSMIVISPEMKSVMATVERVAKYKTTALLLGESGTGKEMIARAIHEMSDRRSGPFVAVNCGAIPENLLESEFFGHVKGAFTDAVRDKTGLFEEASNGTLFMDEIGELPPMLQVKLLRVLQEEEIRRVGDTQPRKINVRIIAATLKNLEDEVAAGRFRDDLYYRLNVFPIRIPPLRERRGDIMPLAAHFLEKFSTRHGRLINGFAPGVEDALRRYGWPGNVRELENSIERAVVLCEGDMITESDLPFARSVAAPAAEVPAALPGGASPADQEGAIVINFGTDLSIPRAVETIEELFIRRALDKARGNRAQAAKILGIANRTLLYKLQRMRGEG